MTSPSGLFGFAPLMLVAYLALAILAPTLCRHLGRGALIVLALLPGATTVWALAMLPSVMDGGALTSNTQWVPSIDLAIELRMDALAMVLTLIVAFIGMLVLLYSARYFPPGDDGLAGTAAR